ncbi:hypothetical protein OROHE_019628 [Orobanche hederae]
MSVGFPLMRNSDAQRSLVETTVEAPCHRLQSSKHSGRFPPEDTYVLVPENNREQGMSEFQESAECDAVSDNKSKTNVPEIEEKASAIKQEVHVTRSEKCTPKIQVIDDTTLIEPSLPGNGRFNNDNNDTEMHRNRQETKEKKEKRPRQRVRKARQNKVILNSFSIENKEKLGQQYSRKELEVLRFEGLEEQKNRWVKMYCGLSPLVQQEYDALVRLDKTHQEDSVLRVDFDPRPQFKKSADLGEGCLQFVNNHLEDLLTDDIGCSAVEGECSADDDSDEDYSSIQRPAFFVTGKPDFDSGPPQDGIEYLRRVRGGFKGWEADRIPKVTVVKVNKIKEQSVYMPQIPDIMKCQDKLLPLKQWEESFLADFSELRQAFSRIDPQGSSSKSSSNKQHQTVYEEDILGQMLESTSEKFVSLISMDDSCMLDMSDHDAKVNPQSSATSSLIIDPPTISKILKIDSAARTSMLKRMITSIENMSTLPHDTSLLLFTLCVAVDCPLDADTSAAFRSLLRKCASLRAAKEEVDDEVVILNILVTISGRYFGQLEL